MYDFLIQKGWRGKFGRREYAERFGTRFLGGKRTPGCALSAQEVSEWGGAGSELGW